MGRRRLFWVPTAPQGGEGGDERWLITYADMITLLLVLFIILYSMANTDLEKFQALAESLREGFGATASGGRTGDAGGSQSGTHPVFDTEGGGITPLELFPENQIPIEIFEFAQMLEGMGGQGSEGGLMDELQRMVEEAAEAAGREGIDVTGMGANIQIEYNERGIRIIIFPDQILFESGSARIRPGFREILDRLYEPLTRLRNRIEIQGHTDSVPINTATFPSNWELSAGRAGAVIRYFEQKGMPPARLQAAGYADTIPRAENTTREGRAKNRRVELLVLRGENISAADWAKQVSQLDSDKPIQNEHPAGSTVGNGLQASPLPEDEELVTSNTGH
jgi:chemotaxis protein MotB